MKLYLAHPLDSRKEIRKWELEIEKLGIELINPFYDSERSDIEKIDAGRERYESLNHGEIVTRDLKYINEADGTIAFITGDDSYGTIMEIVYSYIKGKTIYLVITNGHEGHPWLKFHSDRIFTSNDEAKQWLKQKIEKQEDLKRE